MAGWSGAKGGTSRQKPLPSAGPFSRRGSLPVGGKPQSRRDEVSAVARNLHKWSRRRYARFHRPALARGLQAGEPERGLVAVVRSGPRANGMPGRTEITAL